MEIIWVNRDVAYAEQPSFRDLRHIRELGFRTVVDLRLDAEQPTPEDRDSRRVGLDFVRIAVPSVAALEDEHFLAFEKALRLHPRPVLVHSAEGARAGVLAVTWHAVQNGWTAEQLDAFGRGLGLDIPDGAFAYLRRKSRAYAEAREARP